MTTQELLNAIFCQVFDDKDIVINPAMTANDIDGWDSLTHVNLIIAVEGKFAIRFAQKELLTFKIVSDLLNTIEKKLTEKTGQ